MKRLESLDALRGFDMFMIVGGKGAVLALLVALGFGTDCWLGRQLVHVEWDHACFWDFIYPLFVFVSGVTYPFSRARQIERGVTRTQAYRAILKRVFWLIALGALVYGNVLTTGRFTPWSVLGRIGICWGVAATLYVSCSLRARIAWFIGIPVAYWLLLRFVAAPGAPVGADSLADATCLVSWLDQYLSPGFRHQYALSVVPMISTALLGMFAGDFLRWRPAELSGGRRAALLALGGCGLAAVGFFWAHGLGWMSSPLNKKLWSASLVFAFGGFSMILLAAFYWVIDVKGFRAWAFFFKVIGMNAILLYVGVQSVFDVAAASRFVFGGLASLCSPAGGRLVLALGQIAVYWLILWFFYRRKIFLKV